jgi:cell cycle checkpoint protein
MAPPAKRRKRAVVLSSDEEDDEKLKGRLTDLISSSPLSSSEPKTTTSARDPSQASTTPTKSEPRAKAVNHHRNAAPIYLQKPSRGGKASSKSASSSPEKSRRKGKTEEKGKSGDIFTFFTKQAQRQQADGGSHGSISKPKQTIQSAKLEEHDLISDDDDVVETKAQHSSLVGLAARKRARGAKAFKSGDRDMPNTSQKFLVKPTARTETRSEEDTRPWAERFSPSNLDELAVHKKKVADVRTWLEDVINGRIRQRLLLLKGAAGSGKTTTVQILSKVLDYGILEWRNPVGSIASSDGVQSMSAQFEEFMGRGGKFGQLDVFAVGQSVASKPDIKPLDRRKNLILIEEFPNTFTRYSTALQSFRTTILQYLASNTPPLSMVYNNSSQESITPVVMIISETLLTTTSASADSFTAHRLLGPEILQHPAVATIEFNAIAPTILAKALELVVQKESRKSGRRKTPGPLVLKKLGEVGDIRSAIGSLEFLCLRGDTDGDWGAKVAFGKAKKGPKEIAMTRMEEESLELVTRREASLGIFHSVGKVVYNKRDETALIPNHGHNAERLPDFMSNHSRPKKSQVCVDELIDETGTDTSTFIAALHENYILSCDAPPTSFDYSSLDHVNGCIDALSDSDLLCPSWGGSFNSTNSGGSFGSRGTGGDLLRQDEISFQVAVRGILFSLPCPVKRKAPAAAGLRVGKGGDAFKMFYPTSLKLWRTKEEIEGTIDLWVTRLLKCDYSHLGATASGSGVFSRPKVGTVESWKVSGHSATSISRKDNTAQVGSTPLMSIGTSARKEMLLERLPYMVFIARARKSISSTFEVRDMEKVTTFHGIGRQSEDSSDDGDDIGTTGEEWATDKPIEGKSPSRKWFGMRKRGTKNSLPIQQPEQSLVLSDDDIEDD